MNVTEDTEDEVSALTRADSQVKQIRPDSPVPGRCLSMKSNKSMEEPIEFDGGGQAAEKIIQANQERPDTSGPSCVSMRSGRSMSEPIEFEGGRQPAQILDHRQRSKVISRQPARPQTKPRANVDSIFTLLEDNIVAFVKSELWRFKRVVGSDRPGGSEEPGEEEEVTGGGEEEEQRASSRDAFLRITLNFLRQMKQEQLADSLQSKTLAAICHRKLKSNMKEQFRCVFEGIAKAGNPTLLDQVYTELYITEAGSKEVSDEQEVRRVEAESWKSQGSETTPIRCEDIFEPLPGRREAARTLLTKGVAGVGKTILTRKFSLDWAEDKTNHSVEFVFPFTFRELNLLRDKKLSLVELVHLFFAETKEAGICRFENFRVVFIFDGLDECRLPLDFHRNEILTDVTESASVDVLLTNLIRGKLLPSARLWVTTRPAAANQIPPECVDMVTEVRGFTDPQKDEYFRKRFRGEEEARRVLSHIETSRSLHIMCHIPVFCWITATVLDQALKNTRKAELPKTLTEMYIHFLVAQTKRGSVKYHGGAEADPVWNAETKKTVLALGKLAFEQLERGNLIFYEADLRECDVDVKAASVDSGLFTEIFRGGGRGLNQDRVFCFVHLSVQEFLAALYVSVKFVNTGVNLLRKSRLPSHWVPKLNHLYQTAVDLALQSPNGHLDSFVCFLLGLSVESNRTLLRGLLKKSSGEPQVREKLVRYIKKKIRGCPSAEKSINLFHCLNELNDHSLVEEIQQYLTSGGVSQRKLSSSQWWALVFILLSSQKDPDAFDLKKFSASEEGLLRLLPVVRVSRTSLLSGCNLSGRSCEALASVLTLRNCNLRELDLSDNDLHDEGLQLLSSGLRDPQCRLEILSLSGCLVTQTGVDFLASALDSNPSHLRELDLSFNHPGDSGAKLLSALKDPSWKLETLKIDHCGKCRLQPSPLRYFCEFSLDPNTADRNLRLSRGDRAATVVMEKQPYPDRPERFDGWKQLLCADGLAGRSYWEVRWTGRVHVGAAYRGIGRRGVADECGLGWNDRSWSLQCTARSYTAWHGNQATAIDTPPPPDSTRVGVYLDWAAGTLSFYALPSVVSSVRRVHLHTFHASFTEPLYPAFGFGRTLEFGADSSVCLSPVGE